jgi:hypothetical protein
MRFLVLLRTLALSLVILLVVSIGVYWVADVWLYSSPSPHPGCFPDARYHTSNGQIGSTCDPLPKDERTPYPTP